MPMACDTCGVNVKQAKRRMRDLDAAGPVLPRATVVVNQHCWREENTRRRGARGASSRRAVREFV